MANCREIGGSSQSTVSSTHPQTMGKQSMLHACVGTSCDIGLMLNEVRTFQKSKEHEDIKSANAKKPEEVWRLRHKRDQFRIRRHYSHEDNDNTLMPESSIKRWAVVGLVWQKLSGRIHSRLDRSRLSRSRPGRHRPNRISKSRWRRSRCR